MCKVAVAQALRPAVEFVTRLRVANGNVSSAEPRAARRGIQHTRSTGEMTEVVPGAIVEVAVVPRAPVIINGDIMISIEEIMAQLLVRNLDERVKAKLQRRARRHGRSTEEEVRIILRIAVNDEAVPSRPLGSRFKARFARIGLDRTIEELRGQLARPATFTS